MSFADLKKGRKSMMEKLKQEVEATNTNSGAADERFWKLTVDAAQNGAAIIRFLPPPDGEDVPFVRYWDHGFQGPGGWYIEKSRTTLGEDDPVSELNSNLWNSGIEANKDIARKQKRRLHYVSNIYVVKDPANPTNEGKVFLYEYGKSIYDMINDALHPAEDGLDDVEPMNPFDLWEGANFKLTAYNKEGWRNYGKSTFMTPKPLSKDDDELEQIWKSEYSLQDLVSPDQFKSYAELKAKLMRVLGEAAKTDTAEDNLEEDSPWTAPEAEADDQPSSILDTPTETPLNFDDDDEDDSLDFFKKLANE